MNEIDIPVDDHLTNVYIGDETDCNKEAWEQHGIDTIVNVSSAQPRRPAIIQYDYYQIGLLDGAQRQERYFEHAADIVTDLLHERRVNKIDGLLVHCYAGQSRSAAVLAASLSKYLQTRTLEPFPIDQTLGYIKDARPMIQPANELRELAKQYREPE